MVEEIKAVAKAGDSLGGVAEVLAYGVPVGLGSHVHWDRRLDGLLAQALMSIQAVKGVEIGDGFGVAGRPGSQAHDPIGWDPARQSYRRTTTRAGGIEGGMSTGELVACRVAMKPLATLNRPVLTTVDVVTKQETVSFKERTDVTAVPAMGVVAETMVALVLAAEALRKFGGDSLAEVVRNRDAFDVSLREI
jgi:chorismate synthase